MTTILEGASKSDSNNILMALLIIIIVIGIAYFIYYLYIQNTTNKSLSNISRAANQVQQLTQPPVQQMQVPKKIIESFDNPAKKQIQNMQQSQNNMSQQSNCSPKEQLTADELLPTDNSSLWAQINPSGEGSFKDKNFLQSGYHIGINTVGQTLRNANLQLRSEPACPQVKVSPWLQATIEPDLGRKPFEIGGCA
jgi:ABC-type lipoprotein release transport system permease subunit